MNWIKHWIEVIEKRPGMYLGENYDIDKLEAFIFGYFAALEDNNIKPISQEQNEYINNFDVWLRKKAGLGENGMGWAALVKFLTPKEKNSLEQLFELKKQYEKECLINL